MPKARWLPEGLQEGLQDLIDQAKPKLTRAEFEKKLTEFLRSHDVNEALSTKVIAKLFDKTFYFLKQRDGLDRMRWLIKSSDWKKRMRALHTVNRKRPITRALKAMEECLNKLENHRYRFAPTHFRKLRSETKTLRKSVYRLESQLRLLERLIAHDKILVSDWLRPEPESQFLLNLENYLHRAMPGTAVKNRRWIIAGCAVTARLLIEDIERQNLLEIVNSRIRRTNASYRREAVKWAKE